MRPSLNSPKHDQLPYGRMVLCVLAGLLQALAAGWTVVGSPAESAPIDHPLLAEVSWLLHLLAAGLLFECLVRPSSAPRRNALACAALFGLSWQAAGVSWLFIGMHRYAGLDAPLSAAAVVALGAYLAGFTVLGCLAFRWALGLLVRADGEAVRMGTVFASAAAFSGAWLLAELGRAMIFSGFPWASSGYAHLQGPFRHLLPWVGVYGTAAAAAGVAALAVQIVLHRWAAPRRRLVPVAGLTAALAASAWLPIQDFTTSAGEFEVSLLQGNVSQESKFQAEQVPHALAWYARELVRSTADVAMTPETAWPPPAEQAPLAHGALLKQRVKDDLGLLLLGVPQPVGIRSHSNTLMGLGHTQTLLEPPPDGSYRYQKRHLVPFAEYTPPGFAWFTRLLNLPLPSFEAAAEPSPSLRIQTRSGRTQTLAPLICFEDLFGEDFAPLFRKPEAAPTAFANASNLAWFDDSPAMAQHLRIAQARSLEFQRPTFRATNTGPTVVIDHLGNVTHALAPRTLGVLHAVVDGRTGITPYASWLARLGLWPLVMLSLVLLAGPALLARQRFRRS